MLGGDFEGVRPITLHFTFCGLCVRDPPPAENEPAADRPVVSVPAVLTSLLLFGKSIGKSKLGVTISADGKAWTKYFPADDMKANADTANNIHYR